MRRKDGHPTWNLLGLPGTPKLSSMYASAKEDSFQGSILDARPHDSQFFYPNSAFQNPFNPAGLVIFSSDFLASHLCRRVLLLDHRSITSEGCWLLALQLLRSGLTRHGMCQCIVGIVQKDGIHRQHLDPAKTKWPFHFLLQNSDLSRSLESMGGSPRTHPLVQLAPGLCLVWCLYQKCLWSRVWWHTPLISETEIGRSEFKATSGLQSPF